MDMTVFLLTWLCLSQIWTHSATQGLPVHVLDSPVQWIYFSLGAKVGMKEGAGWGLYFASLFFPTHEFWVAPLDTEKKRLITSTCSDFNKSCLACFPYLTQSECFINPPYNSTSQQSILSGNYCLFNTVYHQLFVSFWRVVNSRQPIMSCSLKGTTVFMIPGRFYLIAQLFFPKALGSFTGACLFLGTH